MAKRYGLNSLLMNLYSIKPTKNPIKITLTLAKAITSGVNEIAESGVLLVLPIMAYSVHRNTQPVTNHINAIGKD